MRNSLWDKGHMTKESPITLGRSGKPGGLERAEVVTCMLGTNVLMSWGGSN